MPDPTTSVKRLLESFKERTDLREPLAPVVDEILASSAPAFTRHVLGFASIRLAEHGGEALRLHLWPFPLWPLTPPAWPVHSHGWVVESFIAHGSVANTLYQVGEARGGNHKLYAVRYGETASVREATCKEVVCHPARTDVVNAGEYYVVPRGAFHTTEPLEFAATVVMTSPRSEEPPYVVGDVEGRDTYEYAPVTAPADETRALLLHLRTALRQLAP
jgi:hypothetical protein